MRHITSALLSGLTVLLYGCATTGYQRASQTRSAINDARAVTVTIQQELDAAARALHDITTPEVTDLLPPYKSFSASAERLSVQVVGLANRRGVIEKQSDAYFQSWQQELGFYRSPAIRERSTERRREVIETFQGVHQQFEDADQSLRPLLVYLKDMQRYLSTDLTSSGVASAQELASRIVSQTTEAQHRLDSLGAELDRIAAELSSVKPAIQTPTEKKQEESK